MAIPAKLTPLQETEARRNANATDKPKRVISEEEKATRRDRVAKAKDAMARSVGAKGDHVAPARAAIKVYLLSRNLAGWQGPRAAWLATLGFALAAATFVGTNVALGSGRHAF